MKFIDRILFPYTKVPIHTDFAAFENADRYARFSIDGGYPAFIYNKDINNQSAWKIFPYFSCDFSCKEDAMKILDGFLLGMNYILLTAEQADKYKLLI